MKRLLLGLTLLLAGCYGGEPLENSEGQVRYYHDAEHGVSCWTAWDKSITCLPDSQLKGQ